MAAKLFRTDSFKGPLMRGLYLWQLFKLRKQDGDFKERYGCTLVLPKTGDWSAINGALKACIIGQWGDKGIEKFKAGLIRNPILAGDGKEARNKETGEIHPGLGADVNFIRVQASADRRPKVFDGRVLPIVDEDGCPSGSWGYPVLNAFTWDHPQNGLGVSFGIEMFQVTKVATGDEILGGEGTRAKPEDYFEKIAAETGADDGAKTASDLFG